MPCVALVQVDGFLTRYLQYSKVKCDPRLTVESAALLADAYIDFRGEVGTFLVVL